MAPLQKTGRLLALRPIRLILLGLVLVGVAAVSVKVSSRQANPEDSIDPMPEFDDRGSLDLRDGQMVLRVEGAPEEMGQQHGALLRPAIRLMLKEYVEQGVLHNSPERAKVFRQRIQRMKVAIPDWYLREVRACAWSAGVDPDLLLLAQCEGDVASLGEGSSLAAHACSAYVAFGPATADGAMRAGRNFDYWVGDFYRRCALVMYVTPNKGDGLPFAAVGWSGILGGWTLVNSAGLVVANHLGGGPGKNPRGIPTLVMTRIIAQKATTIREAVDIIRNSPRMRGQIIWMAQPADPAAKRPARAVAVEYDARAVHVREAVDGVLIVTNQNFVFGLPDGAPSPGGEGDWTYNVLKRAVALLRTTQQRIITETSNDSTLHAVEVLPASGEMEVSLDRLRPGARRFVRWPLPQRK